MDKTTQELVQKGLAEAYSYEDYRAMVSRLASEGKSTGPEQTEALSSYTVLNDRRMKRFDKTIKIGGEAASNIDAVTEKITLLVLTESWCGDAAPTIPVMNKIAEHNGNIELQVILRDKNRELMERYLTNGAMSIPKLIFLDAGNNPFASWGPRPEPVATMVREHKEEHGELLPEIKEEIQVWYNKDRGQTTLNELLALLPKG